MSQSFSRGLLILDMFTQERRTINLEEISSELDISPITAYRYVKVLNDAGILRFHDGQVSLSAKILRFVHLFMEQDKLTEIAKGPVSQLSMDLNETVALCQFEAPDVVCTYRMESSSPLRTSFSIGQRMSIYAGAFSRAIIAFLPAQERNSVIRQTKISSYTEHTIANLEVYLERLSQIRQDGYDTSNQEVDPGIYAMAVPIFVSNRVVGCLGIAIPSARYTESRGPELLAKLQQASAHISSTMQSSDLLFS
ncbi:IclR family transcriptional regulator [Alicyclobacillus sp. ALC3]|uniref:IclR family transcriptional regulator n=1 Tax=Alicyclobacillus sp. ALC3 TaxID=2796143 RepID=UPI00237839A1|nr:IclR family transcriptional regulator [Alicyclobacillus sp. ALC3]WDL97751.1 IclR family transcriptional regulator [Alicyclobacillus sp. ALC3]